VTVEIINCDTVGIIGLKESKTTHWKSNYYRRSSLSTPTAKDEYLHFCPTHKDALSLINQKMCLSVIYGLEWSFEGCGLIHGENTEIFYLLVVIKFENFEFKCGFKESKLV